MSFNYFTNWCFLPTFLGTFRMYDTGDENIRMISADDINRLKTPPLIRVHSSCIASEIFKSIDCDCADQLLTAMQIIHDENSGLIFHLNQEGRGQGLQNKIKAINLMQQKGLDTYEAFEYLNLKQDVRNYQKVIDILSNLNINKIRLITNNPKKISFFEDNNISIDIIKTKIVTRPQNIDYLRTKKNKLGHKLDLSNDSCLKGLDENINCIKFYEKDHPYGFFSNFSNHAVYLKNKIWKTSEHYYQSQKFADTDYEEEIRKAPKPSMAKDMAEKSSFPIRSDWKSIKISTMREVLYAKFTQHPDLRKELIKTDPSILIEHTENDHYWGDGGNGSGKNMLGNLLMDIRSLLIQ